jgi:TonB family protein
VLFLFDRPFMACADAVRAVRPPRVESYQFATVKKKVAYQWSPAMRRYPIDGVVRLAATVSQTGCIRYVETRRSLQPIYDLATIQAAKAWQYVPASANGTPVESRTNIAFDVLHP